jgi:hypothetical protein
MGTECATPRELGITEVTLKRPYVEMSLYMVLEMSVGFEGLAAVFIVTYVRFLSCVDSVVSLQVTLFVKYL